MCGRYTLAIRAQDLAEELGLAAPPTGLRPRWNIAPTQLAPVVTDRYPGRLVELRWGYIPHWAGALSEGNKHINARSEALERGMFKDALARRRCLVVADGFYEWRREGKKKTPFYVTPTHGRLFTFAGLWSTWRPPGADDAELVRSFTIVTTAAAPPLEGIHDRAPLVVDASARARWLARELPADEVRAMLGAPAPEVSIVEVSPLVNSPSNDVRECIDPAPGRGAP